MSFNSNPPQEAPAIILFGMENTANNYKLFEVNKSDKSQFIFILLYYQTSLDAQFSLSPDRRGLKEKHLFLGLAFIRKLPEYL